MTMIGSFMTAQDVEPLDLPEAVKKEIPVEGDEAVTTEVPVESDAEEKEAEPKTAEETVSA